jgi:hypothetical protein
LTYSTKILNEEIYSRKKRERPRKRWITDTEEDLRRMSIQVWRVTTQDRQEWRRIMWEAKVHTGL